MVISKILKRKTKGSYRRVLSESSFPWMSCGDNEIHIGADGIEVTLTQKDIEALKDQIAIMELAL